MISLPMVGATEQSRGIAALGANGQIWRKRVEGGARMMSWIESRVWMDGIAGSKQQVVRTSGAGTRRTVAATASTAGGCSVGSLGR